MFDGQPCGCLFVGRRNGFVSGDESAPTVTLHEANLTLAPGDRKPPKGERDDEMGKHIPPCARQ